MSWWDYGYQITAMANRTILVDNNTWNNTHISRVGQVSWVTFKVKLSMKCCCADHAAVSFAGHGIDRGKGLRDYARARRQLCSGHLWRADGLLFRWYAA